MSISLKQVQLIKVAVRKLGWSDDMYRSALTQIAGVTTSKDMDTEGFEAFMGFLEYCGFQPLKKQGPDFGARPGMASWAQVELIRALWREYTRFAYDGEDELNKWLTRSFKVSALRFVTADMARRIITSLKAMKMRAAEQRTRKAS